MNRKWIGIALGVALVAAAGVAVYVVQTNASPEKAVATFTSAIAAKDDVGVAGMFTSDLRDSFLANKTEGAADTVKQRFPSVESMQLREVSNSEVWLLNPKEPDAKLTLRKDGGWHVASASYFVTETVTEDLKPSSEVHKTKHLPKGTTVVIARARKGSIEKLYKVAMVDGTEAGRAELNRRTLDYPKAGETYKGTGKRGHGVTRLLTGSKFNKRTYRVTNNSRTIRASVGKLGASWRTLSPKSGDTDRFVMLGPGHEVIVHKASKLKGGMRWYDAYAYSTSRLTEWSRKGRWILIVEKNDRPAVWRVVTVK